MSIITRFKDFFGSPLPDPLSPPRHSWGRDKARKDRQGNIGGEGKPCNHEWQAIESPQQTFAVIHDIYGKPTVPVGLTCRNICQKCGLIQKLPVLIKKDRG